MTGTAFFAGKDGSRSAVWRFVSIVGVFLVVWPPVCACIAWWMKFDFGTPVLGWVAAVAIYSYVFCILPALFAGMVHAIAAVRFHHNSIWLPLVAALGATILFVVTVAGPVLFESIDVAIEFAVAIRSASFLSLMVVSSLLASLICWRLTRRFARTV